MTSYILNFLYALFLLSIVLLVTPVITVISLLIFIVSGLPIFYAQKRVGLNGIPFMLYKFRTMHVGAEKLQVKLKAQNEAKGPVFKIRHDPRFTAIGGFLSHTGLDELPQIINIFLGHMAIVGPRPLPVAEVKKLLPWQKERHKIKPGIISPWIVNGYHSQKFDDWMKSDLEYALKKNQVYDLYLMGKALVLFLKFVRNELREYQL
ncbi:TPA: multidrug MFS transporter [Patescibacteria group bacterium]|uniref:Exopolysaccharide biosynthesis polyprenyl glycosylphosphotransferase n=1 Tax=Candidatus Gottesmanbacteria bacterium GW2011_GWA1_43_11 TaxID=1618436 RepID=A0A0G1CAY7_9BACT|nr:MAG: Exopolysaccharide biosynthesis polyprenyl glycosylphosphotransferase [Candidatus Gottesmanbacteria bacterium GW2011_GWA1_43_11]HCS78709.1 multidrug MFS transporter [Patescibacteria group bacterium]